MRLNSLTIPSPTLRKILILFTCTSIKDHELLVIFRTKLPPGVYYFFESSKRNQAKVLNYSSSSFLSTGRRLR